MAKWIKKANLKLSHVIALWLCFGIAMDYAQVSRNLNVNKHKLSFDLFLELFPSFFKIDSERKYSININTIHPRPEENVSRSFQPHLCEIRLNFCYQLMRYSFSSCVWYLVELSTLSLAQKDYIAET